MKLFYIFIISLFTYATSNAQFNANRETADLKLFHPESIEFHGIPVNTDIIPELPLLSIRNKRANQALILENPDTLTNYFDRSSGFIIYTYQVQSVFLPVVGYNTFYHFIGVKYKTQAAVNVTGLLVAYAAKILLNNYDSLAILMCRGNEFTGLPSEVLSMSRFTLENIDTSMATPVFTKIDLQTQQIVNSNWVILLQTRRGDPNEDDFNAIFSNIQGDGKKEKTACFGLVQNQQLLSNNLNTLPLNINQDSLDFDVMMLPIVDWDVTGVSDVINIDGITIENVYPNPAANEIKISYNNEQPANLRFELIGLDGKIIKSLTTDNLIAGSQTAVLDVSDVASGNYYLGIFSKATKFAINVKIVK